MGQQVKRLAMRRVARETPASNPLLPARIPAIEKTLPCGEAATVALPFFMRRADLVIHEKTRPALGPTGSRILKIR